MVAAKTHSRRVEVPGARAATFKLTEWAPDSFHLFRSSRKIGKAAMEGRKWSATFAFGGKDWRATADGAEALLDLVGTFILAGEARGAAASPLEQNPALKGKGRRNKDERISFEFLKRSQELRVAELDALIRDLRKRISKA